MTDIMRVDTAGLRNVEPAVRYLSSSAASVLARLSEVLDGAGACWGCDQIGATFAESYLPGAQLVRGALPSLRDDMSGVAEALALAADNVDAAEGRAQARLS